MASSSLPALETALDPGINPSLLYSPSSSSERSLVLPPLPPQCLAATRSPSARHRPAGSSQTLASTRSGSRPASTNRPCTPTQTSTSTSATSQQTWLGPIPRRNSSNVDPPLQWGEDSIADHGDPSSTLVPALDAQDETFLQFLADHEFSSPSSYPTLPTCLPPSEASKPDQTRSQPRHTIHPADGGSAAPLRRMSSANRTRASATSSKSRASLDPPTSVGASQSIFQSILQTNDDCDDELLAQSSNSSFSDKKPLTPRQPPPTNESDYESMTIKRVSTPAFENHIHELLTFPSVPEDDLFADSLISQASEPAEGDDMTRIDLTKANEVPEDLRRPEEDNRVKISKFQCVICMDDASTLTVTHCGHLYCAQCLHSSLHVEATRGKCPMCRARIDMKSRGSYNTKTKGFWPLELKLMTATRKGKRKADDIS